MTPEKMQEFFSEHLGSQADSSFFGNAFPDEFEQFFSHSFSGKQDSVLMKKFGIDPKFHRFGIPADSLAISQKDFDGFFYPFGMDKNDSVLSKLPEGKLRITHPKTIDDIMKMLQQQMQKMEDYQRKYFKE